MKDSTREKLIALGAERLAEELLKLGQSSDASERLVYRLISGNKESVALFTKTLSAIKRRKRFITRGGSGHFYRELVDLLQIIDNIPADDALPLLVKLFQADKNFANQVDDSNGVLADFYYHVTEQFCSKANELKTQSKLIQFTKKILKENDYGCRDQFVQQLDKFLDEVSLKKLFTYYKSQDSESNERGQQHYLESIARQLKAPQLYEELVLSSVSTPNSYHYVDIAEVYFDCGDAETALHFMRACDGSNTPLRANELLQKIYINLGMKKDLMELLTKHFQIHPTAKTYTAMLEITGSDEGIKILEKLLEQHFSSDLLDLDVTALLLDLDKVELAESYLLQRASELDGERYSELPALAKSFTALRYDLPATLITRALMTSLLERAISKNYGIAVRYLGALHNQQEQITDWKGHPDHTAFLKLVHADHYRKSAFWSKVPSDQTESLHLA